MDWVKRINDALAYVEANLDNEIDYAEAGKLANCSAFHFQRVFAYMAGTSLAEYVRRRRLTLAVVDLRNGEKVIDVAMKYGYNSPTAFSRAFAQFHGFPPSETKNSGVTFASFPPISFQIIVKGVVQMNYKIEKKEAMRVVGVKLTTSLEDGRNLREIPAFWEKTMSGEQGAKIVALADKGREWDGRVCGTLGVCVASPKERNGFDYLIAVVTDEPVPEGLEEFTIPASEWAIFESVGALPQALQETSRRVFTEWLPSSGYEYSGTADIEVYSSGDVSSKDYRAWVWVPIATTGTTLV